MSVSESEYDSEVIMKSDFESDFDIESDKEPYILCIFVNDYN